MEIRTLQESPDDLAAFVTGTWRSDYGGRMVMPLWTPEYFDWQLKMSVEPGRRQLLGAYEGTRLIGALLGVRQPFYVDDQRRAGLLSSWLTIAPDFRGGGLVPALKAEQTRRLQEEGGEVILSYRYHGTRDSLADRPVRGAGDEAFDLRRVGLWVRLLDAKRAMDWYLGRTDRWLTRLGKPFLGRLKPRTSSITVREATEEDMEACLVLLSEAATSATLAIDWDRESLWHHLRGGTPAQGLVACRDNNVVGLLGYHILPFLGRTAHPLGVIDLLLLDPLRHQERVTFLRAGLARMQQAGAILAVKMGLGDLPIAAMLDADFIPRGRDSLQVLRWLRPEARTALRGRQLVLWR